MTEENPSQSEMIDGSASNELSSNRTAMSLERTGMSVDRTLMSVERTSLSLIGFGFTIFQFFHTLQNKFLDGALHVAAPRRFGLALIAVGILLLTLGIITHIKGVRGLKARRARLIAMNLLHPAQPEHVTPAMLSAILLLGIGVLAIASVTFRIGPF